MANFYWVGGTGSWSEFATHWATTSGGGTFYANAPTSSDDVFIDANSGFGSGGIITIVGDTYAQCNNFTSTSGHNYSIVYDSADLAVNGNCTLEAGTTFDDASDAYLYLAGSGTLTCNGASINWIGKNSDIGTTDGTYTLQDSLTAGDMGWGSGTFDANDNNVTITNTCGFADSTMIGGSGTWEVGNWQANAGATITPETSTIKFTNTVEGGFIGGGKTYNNIWFAGSALVRVSDSNTFNDFKIDAGLTVKFDKTTTQTVTTFTASGTDGNLIILDTYDAAGQFNLSKASGVVDCDYLNISNSNATGGATWYAGSHSADTANNDGWIFTDAPTTNRHYYYDDD